MKHNQTALQKAMNTTMAKSLNNLLAAEEIARINVKTSKMTIDQAKVYLTSELEKWQSLITEKQYQDRNVEQSVLQHVKELLFLVNNLMQAPTVVLERERFRTQLTVCKKVYKNSLLCHVLRCGVSNRARYSRRFHRRILVVKQTSTKLRQTELTAELDGDQI